MTMLALAAGDATGGLAPTGRLAALAFALLLSLPLAAGLAGLLAAGTAERRLRAAAALATLLWLGGLGAELFVPGASRGALAAAHSLALLGGAGFAGVGLRVLRGLAGRAA